MGGPGRYREENFFDWMDKMERMITNLELRITNFGRRGEAIGIRHKLEGKKEIAGYYIKKLC